MTDTITDIWFRSGLRLEDLGARLELAQLNYDAESYWEWVTGHLREHQLDITRTHRLAPEETETRIFLLGPTRAFPPDLVHELVRRLQLIGIRPISLGSWRSTQGNKFELLVAQVIE